METKTNKLIKEVWKWKWKWKEWKKKEKEMERIKVIKKEGWSKRRNTTEIRKTFTNVYNFILKKNQKIKYKKNPTKKKTKKKNNNNNNKKKNKAKIKQIKSRNFYRGKWNSR